MNADFEIPEQLLRSIADLELRPCAITLDESLQVVAMRGHIDWYGYNNLTPGSDATEIFPFLHGAEAGPVLEWPLMNTVSGKSANIKLLTQRTPWLLLLTDSTALHSEKQAVQQIANEARILGYRKDQMAQELIIARDEIEEKRAEAEEANQLKGRFIASMSHEFRTPLTSILGYNDRLMEQADESDRATIAAVRRSAIHLLDLVSALLDQGKLDENKLEIHPTDTNIGELLTDIEAIFEPLARKKGLKITFDREGLPTLLHTDPTRLRQILVNLIGNAVKFTTHGEVLIRCRHSNDKFSTEIYDTGPGIPESEQRRIFLPFQRMEGSTKSGAGLGLSTTKHLVELLGGSIDLHSTEGEGSCFRFSIQAPTGNEQTATLTSECIDQAVRGKTLLLIEDDEDIAALYSMHLGELGLEVLHAVNYSAAIAILAGLVPDIVLTDLNLPDTGESHIVALLRDGGYSGPLLVISASGSSSDLDIAVKSGADQYLTKPIDFNKLIHMVAEYLDPPV